jgi:hypothetical protein
MLRKLHLVAPDWCTRLVHQLVHAMTLNAAFMDG